MYDLYVVLGCFGLRIDDFVNCAAIENTILKVHTGLYGYNEILEYFDTCRLYDKPLLELNAIRHFVFNLQNRFDQKTKPLWLPKRFELYQKFVIDHRHCGLYVKLVLPEEVNALASDFRSKPAETPEKSPTGLRLVRGRR